MEPSQEGGTTSGEEIDGEDTLDSVSSTQKCDALDEFRKEWKRELEASPTHVAKHKPTKHVESIPLNIEDKAKLLFQLGIENEENGKFYEAIQFYRRAVQLVPDIEIKLFKMSISQSREPDQIDSEEEEDAEEQGNDYLESAEVIDEVPFDPDKMDLLTHLCNISFKEPKRALCMPRRAVKETHFSSLPMEIFLYVLKWVVSTDLDFRSLEMCSGVCRGFYICCRDTEIWKTACARVWGIKCNLLGGQYLTWRDMFIKRPRLHFGGCYISKTTYIRHGENSFQDQHYRPWHIVEYYRYLRFFPDGTALMLTSPDEPVRCVGLLKGKYSASTISNSVPIFSGYYRLLGSTVSIVLHTKGLDKISTRPNSNQTQSITFHLETEIRSYRNRLHGQLVWRGYTVFTNRNGVETNTTFDLAATRFPPFWYSRVKSYSAVTTKPLSH